MYPLLRLASEEYILGQTQWDSCVLSTQICYARVECMSSCLLVTLLGEHLNENTISNQKYVGCRQIGGNIQERLSFQHRVGYLIRNKPKKAYSRDLSEIRRQLEIARDKVRSFIMKDDGRLLPTYICRQKQQEIRNSYCYKIYYWLCYFSSRYRDWKLRFHQIYMKWREPCLCDQYEGN